MKTWKYVNFVTILIIFAVVSVFTGCGGGGAVGDVEGGWTGDGPNDKQGGTEFRWESVWFGEQGVNIQGTFDVRTWMGIKSRIRTAIGELRVNAQWFSDQSEYETFNEKFEVNFITKKTPVDPDPMYGYLVEAIVIIIVESDHGKLDYQYYKVTDGTHLYLNHEHIDRLLMSFYELGGERMLIKAINALYDGVLVSE